MNYFASCFCLSMANVAINFLRKKKYAIKKKVRNGYKCHLDFEKNAILK